MKDKAERVEDTRIFIFLTTLSRFLKFMSWRIFKDNPSLEEV